MHLYSIWQWGAFFLLYCFIGWIIESTYVSILERRFVNRGFMRGPCLPLYGFGALTILFCCEPFRARPALVFLLGMVSCSILEYLTGFLMETLFKTKYWDYSHRPLNLQGRVCLSMSLAWGFLSLVMVYLVQTRVEALLTRVPAQALTVAVCVAFPLALADFAYAFHTALSLAAVLRRMTELKAQLDEIHAQLNDAVMQTERGRALLIRAEALKTERQELVSRVRLFTRSLLMAFPSARSRKFGAALVELKDRLDTRLRQGE